MPRGRLIVIEGLDRSGKSTQCSLLHAKLQSHGSIHAAELLKFPDRTTTIGKMIDGYLRSSTDLDDHVIHLLFSANRWELAAHIRQSIDCGSWIVLDRYLYSGIAFSVIKGLSEAWCRAPEFGLPEPDVILFLDIDPHIAQSRGGYGEERYERTEVQRSVRGQFMRLFEGMEQVNVVDAGRSVEEVQREVWGIVEAEMNREVGDLGTIQQ